MTHEMTPPRSTKRFPSGIMGLDSILRGGFLTGNLYMITGMPGTGKTILINQICFNYAAQGGRSVFISILAESHSRMIMHLRSLSFFDSEPIGDALYYISGYNDLVEHGLRGLLDVARRTVRERNASLLVIDGIAMINEVKSSELDLKRFLLELQVHLDPLGCTAILTQSDSLRTLLPQHTMVDGLIELIDEHNGLRAVRQLEVVKFRGSGYLRGRHFFTIGDNGIVVYPRTEALLALNKTVPSENTSLHMIGVSGLDTMIGGGVLGGSNTAVLGSSGTGKTVMGLHFLAAGARAGEPGLFFGFYEPPPHLIAKANRLGLDFSSLIENGMIEVIWVPPSEYLLDAVAEQLLAAIERRGVQRLCIDGFSGLQEALNYSERVSRFFAALINELRVRGVTTLCTFERRELSSPIIEVPITGISAIVDNLIFLRATEVNRRTQRLISIVKMRESDYDSTVREFHITERGIEVAAPIVDEEPT